MDAKYYGNREKRAARFASRRKGPDRACQLRPRHNKIHLFEKRTLACSLGEQFKSGEVEGGLFHEDIMIKSGTTMTFAASIVIFRVFRTRYGSYSSLL